MTINADVARYDEELVVTEVFRKIMKSTLHKRIKMAVVRLEVAEKLSEDMQAFFCEKFQITPDQIFRTKMPMKLSYIFAISGKLPEPLKKALI